MSFEKQSKFYLALSKLFLKSDLVQMCRICLFCTTFSTFLLALEAHADAITWSANQRDGLNPNTEVAGERIDGKMSVS